jgi:phospholipid/cholesterol/gamma-HCH transport system permease protein
MVNYQNRVDIPGDIDFEDDIFYLQGNWTRQHANAIQKKIKKYYHSKGQRVIVDASSLNTLDTTGALLLENLIVSIRKGWSSFKLIGFSRSQQALLDLISSKDGKFTHLPKIPGPKSLFEIIGRETMNKLYQLGAYLAFTGQFVVTLFHSFGHFSPLRMRIFLNAIDEMGYKALPIIALLSFLVGVVLAYQIGIQLENYGANAFMVNLIGQAFLREFGPLITAIIGAGRTSAGITAQLGTMKIDEEIDALKTMGFSPFEVLVIPQVLAALVTFPLLTFWSNIFGVLGGMIMTKIFFGMQYSDFLTRFREVNDVGILMIGISKAPAFALIISIVGCFQGLHVSTSAENVGLQTTKAVVQSIFFIIIADAIYAILYSKLNI